MTLPYTRNLALLAIAVLLAGCATRPPITAPQPEPQPAPPQPQPPGQVTPLPPDRPPEVSRPPQPVKPSRPAPPQSPKAISSPAVMSLLDSADSLARAGRLRRAAAMLERAINIEPRNPFIYQRLAAVRLAQGKPTQAEALAHKSNSLAVHNPSVQADNWLLIAKARRMGGNQAGYRKAMAKVEKYRLQNAALK